MFRKLTFILCSLAFLTLNQSSCNRSGNSCRYQVTAPDIQVEWTAFKTTQKVAVKGGFNQSTLSGDLEAKDLPTLMKGLKIEIDGSSVASGNPGRDTTLKDFFFAKIPQGSKITAAATRYEGDDSKGKLWIKIELNGVTQELPFDFSASPDGVFEAKATTTMPTFQLQPALDSIHQACEVLHRGPDGASKTWEDLELRVHGKFQKQCS